MSDNPTPGDPAAGPRDTDHRPTGSDTADNETTTAHPHTRPAPAESAPTGTWDPTQYLRHADHRSRPFHDLLNRVPTLPDHPHPHITDLGCGPGNTTATLFDRWPGAHVTGIDNSPQMLATAAAHAGPSPTGEGTLRFHRADIAHWTPEPGQSLIVSNAALHWIPGHENHFPRWIRALRPGGTLAFQVPGNFTSPSHTLLRQLTARPHWHHRLNGLSPAADAALDPAAYLQRLTALGCAVDAWETTYTHILHGPDPVLDWIKGSALRPVLSALDDPAEQNRFTTEYARLLREAYPPGPAGTLFPFRRVFVIATTPPTRGATP